MGEGWGRVRVGEGVRMAFRGKQGRRTVHEDSDALNATTFSLTIEVQTVTHAIRWTFQNDTNITHTIIRTDPSTCSKK